MKTQILNYVETELTYFIGFPKNCRDMTCGNLIEIKSVGSELILCCNGDFACQETCLCETNNGRTRQHASTSPETPIQGKPCLKYIYYYLQNILI